MNIWLFNPYGPIPGEGWRDYRFTMLGKTLAERGHHALWWTANFSHNFKHFRSETWKDLPITCGFQIRLVPTTRYSSNVGLGRVRFESIYAWRTYRRALGLAPPGCIVATDPSQIVGYMAVRLAKRSRVPLILDVFDLWPELFELAFPRNLRPLAPLVFSPLYWLRRHNYARADGLTSLCNTYLEVARKGASRSSVVPSLTTFNGIDLAAFRALLPDDREMARLRSQMGKEPGDVWAIYTGSLGNNYDIEALLQAGLQLGARATKIKIWILGEGPLRPYVTEFIKAHRLENVAFLGTILEPRELIKLYRACDIALCPYTAESNVGMPNKAYDYMAAGLPMVNSLRGELESFLRERHIGIQYTAGDPDSLAGALLSLAADRELRELMARNSYDAAALFDSHIQYKNYVDLIERVTSDAQRGGNE